MPLRRGTGWGEPQRTEVSTIRCPVCLRARVVSRSLGDTRPTCSPACHERWEKRIYDFVCHDEVWGNWAAYCARTEQIDEDIMMHIYATRERHDMP